MINIFGNSVAQTVVREARTPADAKMMATCAERLGAKDVRVRAVGTWREVSRRKYGGELVFCGSSGLEIVGGYRVGLRGRAALLRDGDDCFRAKPETDGLYMLVITF